MATKLTLYNSACLILGERKLSSLSENVVMRRRLDSVYDDGFVKDVLSHALWNCAMRDVELSYSPSVAASFGYQYDFDKPEDWVRTALVSADGSFKMAYRHYEDKGAYWSADIDTLYVRFVSDHVQNGGDLSLWTPGLTTFAEQRLAWKVARITTGSKTDADELEISQRRMLIQAKSIDAMDEASRPVPQGSWISARRAGNNPDRSGGW